MSEFLRPFFNMSDQSSQRPYAPFLPAIERGDVDLDSLTIDSLDDPLGVILAAGRIPRQNHAGVVILGKEVWAVDHAKIEEVSNGEVTIGPSSKDSVDKVTGKVQETGIIALTSSDGRIRYLGGAIDTETNPWLAYETGMNNMAGRIAVIQFGLDYPCDYEATDVSTKTGSVRTKPRIRYW